MATDLALYVLADPLHAALILASAPGSGFDDGHHVENVHFRHRGDGPAKDAMLASAAARDAETAPLLEDLRRRAADTLSAIPETTTLRNSSIPISRLTSPKLKAMGIADRAPLHAEWDDMGPETSILCDRYLGRAFVIDLDARAFLLRYAERAGTDLTALRTVLDAGLGRVATVLAE
jgi:hypothetical protein